MLANDVLTALGERSRAISAASIAMSTEIEAEAGLYSWWADDTAREMIAEVLEADTSSLIYLGQAGAGASRQTLRGRIRGNHINGNVRSSTFRRTLTSILSAAQADCSDQGVSAWIKAHLSVSVVPIPDRPSLFALEEAALRRYDPPLNLQGVPRTEVRRRLSRLRGALGR